MRFSHKLKLLAPATVALIASMALAYGVTLATGPRGTISQDKYNRVVQAFSIGSFADTLTAAGSTQATGLQLFNQTNRVSTTGAGTGVVLPNTAALVGDLNADSLAGASIVVINAGVSPLQVYGSGTDTINDVTATTGVTQMPNSAITYQAANIGKWYAPGIGSGYSGQFSTISSTDNITATPSGTQGTSLQAKTQLNRVVNIATTNDGFLLPASAPGMQITIINAHASNAVKVFAVGSDTIDGTAGATGFSQVAGKTATYYCTVAGAWHKLLSA